MSKPRSLLPRSGVTPALALVGTLLLSGCANLQAVRDFAMISAATADYQQIVADYATSPTRQKRYYPPRFASQLDATAETRAEQRVKLEAVQSLLVTYMTTLGDLAADELPNVDAEIDTLGKTLEKTPFVGDGDAKISKATASAAGTIAKILTRTVLDQWRQKRLRRIIQEADPSVQTVIAGLREIVLVDFKTSLDLEEEAVRKYFESAIAAAKASGDTEALPPLAHVLWLEHSDRIAVRRLRLGEYAAVLEKIGDGHADLSKNVDTLGDKELAKRLARYARDLQKLFKAIASLDA